MNILAAIDDPKLFGSVLRKKASWAPWRAFLAVLFGLAVPIEQQQLVRDCTGLQELPTKPFSEAWLVCGRRAGKSFVLAIVAVFLACFRAYAEHLTAGERGTIMVIAADRRQARTILRYVRGLLAIPMLARLVERETAEGFDLNNRVTIEVGTASIKSVRGYTIVAALCDELAFWPGETSVAPDYEILDALRPGMATIPGAMLLCASSPYSRRGALWDAYRRFFGKADAPALVWRAATRMMNETVPQRVIDEAMQRDPASASAEYLAEFRNDLESFVQREVVENAVVPNRYELSYVSGTSYFGFVDLSGAGADAMTLAIAHKDKGGRLILDAIRERKPPVSPESVAIEFAELAKTYRLTKVVGDRYAGEWPRERFREHGVVYELTDKVKSDIYRESLPHLISGKVELLDNPRLVAQIIGLERRTSRSGRDSIDHAPNSHDDLANAVCGAILLAASKSNFMDQFANFDAEAIARSCSQLRAAEVARRYGAAGPQGYGGWGGRMPATYAEQVARNKR